MKILHVTDSHGTVKAPESRRDIYYISFLRKLYEIGMIVKVFNVDMIIHTGDLFHTARVSDKFAGQVAELIKATKVPFYVVPGNHDIEGYTTDTIDQTKLGLLAKTGVIKILDRENPIVLNCNQDGEEYTIAISGQEYYAHIDEGNMKDFEMQQDECDLNILAIHGYISDTPQHPSIKHTMCQDIVTDADLILSGHYHRQFEWSDGQSLDIFNPGSMMRVDQSEYNKTHIPQYGILDVRLDSNGYIMWDYKFHAFKTASPSTEVFDYSSKYKAKQASITLENFKASMANSASRVSLNTNNIVNIIQDICKDAFIETEIEKKAIDVYNVTLQSIPDEFEAPVGFIESPYRKKIKQVVIKNFQSHADTTIEFDQGLNIIVGESNNGKTSIIRAIMWVIDNQPLGTDFIMAGQNECSVSITYDDGTFITRGRTLKDTGYYKVGYFDENGVMQTAEYRGFTNAIPIEVVNTHQMPKVNITKDIETHLNVLSQLDSPFLITESPTSKASAIGRITGTHVLDAGVKNCNNLVLNNKKTIKVHSETLAEKEAELCSLPDVDLLEKVGVAYETIIKAIEAKYNAIDKLDSYQKAIIDNDNQIDLWRNELQVKSSMAKLKPIIQYAQEKQQRHGFIYDKMTQCNEKAKEISELTITVNTKNSIVKLKPIIQHAQEKKQKCDFIHNKLMQHNEKAKEISELTIVVNANKNIAALGPIIELATNHMKKVSNITDMYDKIAVADNALNMHESKVSNLRDYVQGLNSIYVHCQILMSFVEKVSPKLKRYHLYVDEEKEASSSMKLATKTMNEIKAVITETQKERTDYVLQNGVCPCCGQSVFDASHSELIIDFFTNNTGGQHDGYSR